MAGNSQAMTGLGIKIRIKVPPATAFVEIGEPFEITPPQQLDDEIEVTHFSSPDGVKEYIGGLTDPGECSFTVNYVPGGSTETLILAAKATRKPVPFEFEWPNGAVCAFDLLVRGFQPAAPLNDRLTAQVTGRCSGSIVRESGE